MERTRLEQRRRVPANHRQAQRSEAAWAQRREILYAKASAYLAAAFKGLGDPRVVFEAWRYHLADLQSSAEMRTRMEKLSPAG